MLQKWEGAISQEGNIPIITKRHTVQRIAQQNDEKVITQQPWTDKVLPDEKDEEEREEAIAVDVKGVEPFHGLFGGERPDHAHVSIGNRPKRGRDNQTDTDEFKDHRPSYQSEEMAGALETKREGPRQRTQ